MNPFDGVPDGMFTVPNRQEKRAYERKRAQITLAFDGHATLDGLEITCRQVSLGKVMDLMALGAAYQRAETGSDVEREALCAMLREFGEMVSGWNYQEDGQDVPFTWEMLRDEFDYAESMAIVNAHQDAVQGVAAGSPLPQTSAGGQPSVEVSIPMDEPSALQAS